jgi:hypothetical protein
LLVHGFAPRFPFAAGRGEYPHKFPRDLTYSALLDFWAIDRNGGCGLGWLEEDKAKLAFCGHIGPDSSRLFRKTEIPLTQCEATKSADGVLECSCGGRFENLKDVKFVPENLPVKGSGVAP